jgi:hypothetical protein
MQPRIKLGLSIGGIGLVLNICVAGFIGLCGPVVSLLSGGIAGYLTAQQEKLPTKSDGAKAGAVSGGIAGALVIIGQIIGGLGALAVMQFSGTQLPFGQVPSASGEVASSVAYYIGGLGTGICIGIVGALLAAGVGAGAGYMGTQEQASVPPPM